MKHSKKDRMRMEGGKYSRTVGERIKRGTERLGKDCGKEGMRGEGWWEEE